MFWLVVSQLLYFPRDAHCLADIPSEAILDNNIPLINNLTFPDGFLFGAATAAYQIEGAWNVDGKGPSIWDEFTHTHPEIITDHSTGDDACKSYYKYKEDVQAAKTMGLDSYRFSMSWPRIMPTGFPDNINQKGIDYYNNLINELVDNGIMPLVTMYHWDLPQNLQTYGGWLNESIVPLYVSYARVLFENFGDRVKWWLTFNEPQFVSLGYEFRVMAPGIFTNGTGPYIASTNVLKAHARAYHMYDEEFRESQKGKISIAPNIMWGLPVNVTSLDDWEATARYLLFYAGWFTDPIYGKDGDYPKVMRESIAENSKRQGFPKSRLPTFTEEEKNYIKGTADYFAFNAYTAFLVNKSNTENLTPSWAHDLAISAYEGSNWLISNTSSWESVAPISLRSIMNWITGRYGNKYELFITENGFADKGQLNDTKRITYLATYLTEVLKAIFIDEIKMKALTVWSLIDNFEWADGYTSKWGLYHVDFNDPERKRTPKASSHFMENVTSTRKVPKKFLPLDVTIDLLTLWPRSEDGLKRVSFV
uniref:beta-glucosidase n=1 Tax=Rhyparobia maderae TaxID=36963 RepID=Q8WQL9_RHYMA|nr:male-specific beta-glycosidase [Rhyparobia maderae]